MASEVIDEAFATGRAAHPGIDLTRDAFATFVAQRDAATARAADLYLACACANGVAGAAEAFFDTFGPRMASYLGKLAGSADHVDEIRQRVLVRCLVPRAQQSAAIASYSGRGSLEGWVRATAIRESLALRRETTRDVELTESALERPGSVDQSWLVAHYREPVMKAFTAATARLPRDKRGLLRLHYVHGVTTADLARMYQTSRATLVRRLTEAREQLVELLGTELEGHHVAAEDSTQILRLLKGKIDLRLSSLLRETR